MPSKPNMGTIDAVHHHFDTHTRFQIRILEDGNRTVIRTSTRCAVQLVLGPLRLFVTSQAFWASKGYGLFTVCIQPRTIIPYWGQTLPDPATACIPTRKLSQKDSNDQDHS